MIDAHAAAAKEYDLQIAEVGIWRNALAVKEQERQAAMEYSIGQPKLADRDLGRDAVAQCHRIDRGAVDGAWRGKFQRRRYGTAGQCA
ncbi:MAG: hypothetical protein ACLTSZ_19005 [Lachnospiraceae bacterium]